MLIDERGKTCPLPVIEAKKALEAAAPEEVVEVLVDNEIAVQNLCKLAGHKGVEASWKKLGEREYKVWLGSGDVGTAEEVPAAEVPPAKALQPAPEEQPACACAPSSGTVVILSSNQMGQGEEALGRLLMKGFVYALTQLDARPEAVLLYNSGAYLSCEGSDSLEDLKVLESEGVEILTCGTCLNFYGIESKLQVGGVTNMYEIAERMAAAQRLVRP